MIFINIIIYYRKSIPVIHYILFAIRLINFKTICFKNFGSFGNTFTEIQNKFGICPKTIKNAIDEKKVHYGYLWEYV